MSKNEKSLTALLAIAILILLLLWFNARRAAIVHGELELPDPIVAPNFNVWTWDVPQLGISLGPIPQFLSEIYYAKGSCMCQG